jgi:hypothetical protein
MSARSVLLQLALWSLFSYATLQMIHSGLVDVLGPISAPPAWMERLAADLAARGLERQAIDVYKEILDKTHVGSTRRAEIHFQIATLCERDPALIDEAIGHYLRVTYLNVAPGIPAKARERIALLSRTRQVSSRTARVSVTSAVAPPAIASPATPRAPSPGR